MGRSSGYPEEFFLFLSKIRSLRNSPFRELELFIRKLPKLTVKFRPLSYVVIFHRIRSIPLYSIIDKINRSSREGMTFIIDL